MREDQVGDRRAGIERLAPEAAREEIEAGDIADGLGGAEQAGDDREREIEQAGEQHAAHVHGEDRRRLGFRDGDRIDRGAAPRADLVAQRLGAGSAIAASAPSSSLSAGRTAGLELDAGQPEQRGRPGPG